MGTMSIPKITQETISSVTASVAHDDKYFSKFLIRIREENPLIYELIQVVRIMESTEDRHNKATENYLRGVCTVYRLIESQMESEDMNKIWGKKDG